MLTDKATGHIHPISRAIYDIRAIFEELGFAVAVGPELETEWYNFDALNIPADHPARDMQDTFWLKTQINADYDADKRGLNLRTSASHQRPSARLLRTHTSPVQIRYMEDKLKAGLKPHETKSRLGFARPDLSDKSGLGIKPPYRIIVPGKIFRNEATDATHEAQFFQLEGLYVDKEVSMAHLKGVLLYFLKKFFDDEKIEVQFRPSYFPFTEPSAEVFMKFSSSSSPSARGGEQRGGGRWLEMGGSGLVHPNVFRNVGLDSSQFSGFAFGMGLDRLVMLRYGIPDVRMFYGGDLRVVNQF